MDTPAQYPPERALAHLMAPVDVVHDLDPRVDAALSRLAGLGVPLSGRVGLDGVLDGIETLAELVAAGRSVIESQVRDRTAELERANRDILRLIHLRNGLETCETPEEAHGVVAECLTDMFDGLVGALYRLTPSGGTLEVSWGDADLPTKIAPTDCWALRLKVAHAVGAGTPSLSCSHVPAGASDTICVPMFVDGKAVALLHLRDPDGTGPRGRLTRATRHLAMLACDQISLTSSNLLLRKRLQDEALRDPLTRLHNRRFVDDWVEREISRSVRSGRPFGLIMVDVDHFKQTNDVYGHDAGDAVLTAIARTFTESLRLGDVACRYGGEEFLILLPDITLEVLATRADTLRQRVADLRVDFLGSPLPPVAVSAGVAVHPQHGRTAAELVQAADSALYAAKRAGRNRVCIPG